MKNKKYIKEDLISLINQGKSSNDISLYYNVSGRTIRYWLKIENLETQVRTKGYKNVLNLTINQKNIIREKVKKHSENNRVECICEICNTSYKVKKSVYKIGTRFCSRKCVNRFLFKTTPENHPRWLGGITTENQLGRANNDYFEWRTKIFNRDAFTCQKCGVIGGKLNAHHIENWADNKDKRYLLNNGTTLCKKCHNKIHNQYGQKTNLENLLEFLSSNEIEVESF